mgnify:CR=1 FL=1
MSDKHPDWALDLAKGIFGSENDNLDLDLMAAPYCFDADTAIKVYAALEWMHAEANIPIPPK